MSHEIFGDRFLGRRQPAWHGLGTVFPDSEQLSLTAGCIRVKADYTVQKLPLTIAAPDGQNIDVPGKCVIMRNPTDDDSMYRYFGTCGLNYGLLQNMDICAMFDSLVELWPLETMGALHFGKGFFFTLKLPQRDVKGEPVDVYLVYYDFKDGGTRGKFVITPVRVVCQNTLTMGIKAAIVSAEITHGRNYKDELQAQSILFKRIQSAQTDVLKHFTALANARVTQDQANDIFAAAHPYPAKNSRVLLHEEWGDDETEDEDVKNLLASAHKATETYAYSVSRANVMREACSQLFTKFNDEFPAVAGTGWAAYNAVVEVADYRRANDDASADYHAMFGGRAKEKARAFAAALEYTK